MYKLYYQDRDGTIKVSKHNVPTPNDSTLTEAVAKEIVEQGLIPSGDGKVDDVKVNGESILKDKIADIKLKTINNQTISGTGNITIGGDDRPALHTDYVISLNWDPETGTVVPLLKFLDADGQALDTPPEEFRQQEGFGVCLVSGPYSNGGAPEIAHYYYSYEDSTTLHVELLSNSFEYAITQNVDTGEIISDNSWFIINTVNIDNLSIALIYDVNDRIHVQTNAYLDTMQDWKFFAWSIENKQIPVIVIYNDNQILDWAAATNISANEDSVSFTLITSHGLINVEVTDGESGIECNVNWDSYIAPAGGGSSGKSIPIIADKWFKYGRNIHSFILTDKSGEKYAPSAIDSPVYIGVQDPTNNNTMELMLATFKSNEDFDYFVLTSLDGQKIITLVPYEDEASEEGLTNYFYNSYYCTEEDVFNQSDEYIVLYFTTPSGLPYTTYYIPRIYDKILVLKKFKWDTINTIEAPFADGEANVNELLHISSNGQYCILQAGNYHNASIKFITLVFAEKE